MYTVTKALQLLNDSMIWVKCNLNRLELSLELISNGAVVSTNSGPDQSAVILGALTAGNNSIALTTSSASPVLIYALVKYGPPRQVAASEE